MLIFVCNCCNERTELDSNSVLDFLKNKAITYTYDGVTKNFCSNTCLYNYLKNFVKEIEEVREGLTEREKIIVLQELKHIAGEKMDNIITRLNNLIKDIEGGDI